MTKRTTNLKSEPPAPRRRDSRRIIIIAGLAVVVGVLVGAVALVAERKPSRLETVTVGGQRFYVEIADTEIKQKQGLMFRKELPERTGMLFIFDKPQILYFWMRNTYIPLDIIFIDPGRKIINIATMPPLTDDHCQSERPAQFVLELEAGSAEKYGLKPGQKVDISLPKRQATQ